MRNSFGNISFCEYPFCTVLPVPVQTIDKYELALQFQLDFRYYNSTVLVRSNQQEMELIYDIEKKVVLSVN